MSVQPVAAGALAAYRAVDGAAPSTDFGALVEGALNGALAAGHAADASATAALSGQGDLTHVVTAVSRAQLALQTTLAIRDRVLAAYQDIIKMPI